jgi:hypothetical protein
LKINSEPTEAELMLAECTAAAAEVHFRFTFDMAAYEARERNERICALLQLFVGLRQLGCRGRPQNQRCASCMCPTNPTFLPAPAQVPGMRLVHPHAYFEARQNDGWILQQVRQHPWPVRFSPSEQAPKQEPLTALPSFFFVC